MSHSHGPGMRLVEVVGIEHETPLGRREKSKVGDMGVAAGLDDDVGAGLRREVERHHRRRSAVVGKGRFGHSRVSQRHQVGKPVRLLALEDRHWVATRRGNECGVAACAELACAPGGPARCEQRGGPTAARSRCLLMGRLGPMPRLRCSRCASALSACLPCSPSVSSPSSMRRRPTQVGRAQLHGRLPRSTGASSEMGEWAAACAIDPRLHASRMMRRQLAKADKVRVPNPRDRSRL